MARLLALTLTALLALTACGASGDVAQIKAVIERSNHQQEDAFAARDPSLMKDTHTARDFAYMVRTNEVLQQEGAVGIRLIKLEWGDIRISAEAAEAETWETWEEVDQEGNTISSRDRNLYKLVKVGNSWQIDQVMYPDKPEDPARQQGDRAISPAGR